MVAMSPLSSLFSFFVCSNASYNASVPRNPVYSDSGIVSSTLDRPQGGVYLIDDVGPWSRLPDCMDVNGSLVVDGNRDGPDVQVGAQLV